MKGPPCLEGSNPLLVLTFEKEPHRRIGAVRAIPVRRWRWIWRELLRPKMPSVRQSGRCNIVQRLARPDRRFVDELLNSSVGCLDGFAGQRRTRRRVSHFRECSDQVEVVWRFLMSTLLDGRSLCIDG